VFVTSSQLTYHPSVFNILNNKCTR